MTDPLEQRLDSIDRTLKKLSERVRTYVEPRLSAETEARTHLWDLFEALEDWMVKDTELQTKYVREESEVIAMLLERVGAIEHVLFPNASKDKARISKLLGTRSTPPGNPLDRRPRTSKDTK